MTYVLNADFLEKIDISAGLTIPVYIVVALSSLSLYTRYCPEISVYTDNEQEFKFGSTFYGRALWQIIMGTLIILLHRDII